MKLVILVSLALLSSVALCKFSISRFMGPPFSVKPPSGLYDLGGLGFDDLNAGVQVLGYGDFNNDKFTDIVALQDDMRTLNVYLYSHQDFSFSQAISIDMKNSVASVIPADYDYDGKLDLLVITTNSAGDQTNFEYFINTGENAVFQDKANVKSSVSGIVQPFVIDAQGDRAVDLLYMNNGQRIIQTLVKQSDGTLGVKNEDFSLFVSSSTKCKTYPAVANHKYYPFSAPHSNAFVDFNGDCAADLFITSVDETGQLYFEIWLRYTDKLFCLVEVTPINKDISLTSFGDMNNDGRIDLIYASFPEEVTDSMNLHIIYNKYSYDPKYPCTVKDSEMHSPFADGAYNADITSGDTQIVPIISSQFSNSSRLFSKDPVNRPSKIRVGDVNIDGYPDLLFILNDPADENSSPNYGSVILAMNEGGSIIFDSTKVSDEDSAYYTLLDSDTLTHAGDVSLKTIPAISASFYDFDEAGRLGLWIVTADNKESSTQLMGVFNFVNSEYFILKALGLNGIRPKDEDEIVQVIGGIYYGASVECTVTDIDGGATLAKGIQLPQSAYTPLDLPYAFIGLGRTNNYIENFAMGISTNLKDPDYQQRSWTPIIPNSQLIVNPIVSQEWTLDVFVNPTSETVLVILTTIVILILLGAIIVWQHLKEKEEDKNNRQHLINF